MKVIDTTWFTGLNGCVGIVTGEDEKTGERKAFIGATNGRNGEAAIKAIIAYGIRLSPAVLQDILKKLKVKPRR